jgi:hypothetical protein
MQEYKTGKTGAGVPVVMPKIGVPLDLKQFLNKINKYLYNF